MKSTIPSLLKTIAEQYPDKTAQLWKDSNSKFHPTSFSELFREARIFGSAMFSLGAVRESHIGIISENRREWFIADLGIQCAGAVDVPRGCDSTAAELIYILEFAECRICILENESQLQKIAEHKDHKKLGGIEHFIVLDFPADIAQYRKSFPKCEFHTFDAVMKKGESFLEKNPGKIDEEIEKREPKDLATIIFTSGTTGEPKGVMLRQEAFLNQVENVPKLIKVGPGDIWLCVLPVWHSFERIMQYVALGTASTLAYSKPIGKILLQDMATVKPTWMASVPRIWDSVKTGVYRNVNSEGGIKAALFHFFVAVGSSHARLTYRIRGLLPRFKKRVLVLDFLTGIIPWLLLLPLRLLGNVLVFKKIKAKLGGRFVAGISGGGALPEAVDGFFAAAGILLLEGYGLTETAPVLGVRKQKRPVPGTVGPVFPNMQIRIVDENGKDLKPGNKGLVLAKGPQIMSGYLKKPAETAAVLDSNGWLNTGDLGMLTWDNHLKIVGRAKDTIVLLGGENIEPNPIEEKMQESPYIMQSMVVGQDKKYIGALIVPDRDACNLWCKEQHIDFSDEDEMLDSLEISQLIENEIREYISRKNNFRPFEHIVRFRILHKAFEVGDELSQKQEMKRFVISEKYGNEIDQLFT
ncbi:MAG: long-chain fatty acid--CoA ligase [Spirochaetales bacterium]|nr:long-chain fatty acid--CoA ligase [Spirochaetales bacterium]